MRKGSTKPIQELIKKARERIEAIEVEFGPTVRDYRLKAIDDYLTANHSDLEKAFFLMLNEFWNEASNYFVIPSEKVCVTNVYDTSGPLCEYEIDFAVYSGTRDRPVKVAVECDGIRSHRQRHSNRDRRKDVNLQAAGWIVLRFGSAEIQDHIFAPGVDVPSAWQVYIIPIGHCRTRNERLILPARLFKIPTTCPRRYPGQVNSNRLRRISNLRFCGYTGLGRFAVSDLQIHE
jgi:hypothetical protein